MVWPFSPSQDGARPSTDPDLDAFLKQQRPAKYETASQSTTPSTSKPAESPTKHGDGELAANGRPIYAQQSQFADGRYDHLWKNYRPLNQIEALSRSDQEKAGDILTDFKARKSNIKSAAMENCSPELMAQWDCTNGNDISKRVTMCREEGRAIGRCLTMQGRFLRALGYLSEHGRLPEVEEEIQLHADDLYRRMLRQEEMVEAAKKQGVPEPEFPPILSWQGNRTKGVDMRVPGQTFASDTQRDTPDDPAIPVEAAHVNQAQIKQIKDTLRPLGPVERALERAAIAHDIHRATETARTYDFLTQKHERERQLRRDAGTATLGDRIAGLFGR